MKRTYPSLSFDTVYRNLSLFAELGILEMTELAKQKHFRFTCSQDEHHHHIICLDCGKTQEIEHCPMETFIGNVDGFTISGHKFEIYGHCNECNCK